MQDIAQWPAGATYCAQGTVAEDATAGTHICTMTVTPGAGNEMQVLGGLITVGATATAQIVAVYATDGTANAVQVILPVTSGTVTGAQYQFPQVGTTSGTLLSSAGMPLSIGTIVSGSMALILRVSTAAVSVTQTFAVVCRTRGGKPSSVLADTVGAPTLTLNTDKLF